MSLIWPAAEGDVVTGQARLHALIIGVGDYPHLNGGAGTLAVDPLQLSQITTPRFTAPKIAAWLRDSYRNPACPLGSLEVVLSPSAAALTAAGAPNAETATMGHIVDACTRWFSRCNAHADNIAFFYFCGHGLSKDEQFLLAEDFGNPVLLDRWKNCVDFDGLRLGMRRCQAQTQLFFIDACRETPFGMLSQLAIKGDPIITGATFADTVNCTAAFYATGQGRQAFGPDGDVTYFGQALLACLNGVAAQKKGTKWVVNTYQLGSALGQAMAVLARRHRLPLTCNPDATGLARIHEPPGGRVMTVLECTSEAANNVAEIRLENGVQSFHSPPGNAKPLIEDVEAGTWKITVTFPGAEFSSTGPDTYQLTPPVFDDLGVP